MTLLRFTEGRLCIYIIDVDVFCFISGTNRHPVSYSPVWLSILHSLVFLVPVRNIYLPVIPVEHLNNIRSRDSQLVIKPGNCYVLI